MKVYIITIHFIHNFGSVLQAWALNKFLVDNGYKCKIIDYRPKYFKYGRNRIKTIIGRMVNIVPYMKRSDKFNAFIKNNDTMTSITYTTCEELTKIQTDANTVFISGGDQLWNDFHPCGKDPAYKLAFLREGRKIAYGTSLGRDNFEDDRMKKLAEQIADFESVMLRESTSIPLLKPYASFPLYHVIDPVALLSLDDFRRIAIKPKITEPYAVMYLADSSPLLDAAVEMLSIEMNLKIVHICGFKKKCRYDYLLKDAGPEEILGYIINADYILSASFHATIFSILFNKPFSALLPGENTNARIENLLTFLGLNNRVIHNIQELDMLKEPIDYSGVNCHLASFKEKSIHQLLSVIERKETTI